MTEYLDKNGLAHLVQKNNETYALKKENNNLEGQVQSLKAKLKKRDKKIVVRKAINPNSVNEGNVWYYHQNPTLLMGRGCSRYKIFINGEEVTKPTLGVKSGLTSKDNKLYVQYSHEQKRYWTYYKNTDGNNVMWLENRGIAVDLGIEGWTVQDEGYLSRVTAVDYDKNLNMRIVYIEMKHVKGFTSSTSNPYLRIESGHIVSTGKLPFLLNGLSFEGKNLINSPNMKHPKKHICLYNWRRSFKNPKVGITLDKNKYFLCTDRKKHFHRGRYMIKIYKKGIYCGKQEFLYHMLYHKNGSKISYHTRKI